MVGVYTGDIGRQEFYSFALDRSSAILIKMIRIFSYHYLAPKSIILRIDANNDSSIESRAISFKENNGKSYWLECFQNCVAYCSNG